MPLEQPTKLSPPGRSSVGGVKRPHAESAKLSPSGKSSVGGVKRPHAGPGFKKTKRQKKTRSIRAARLEEAVDAGASERTKDVDAESAGPEELNGQEVVEEHESEHSLFSTLQLYRRHHLRQTSGVSTQSLLTNPAKPGEGGYGEGSRGGKGQASKRTPLTDPDKPSVAQTFTTRNQRLDTSRLMADYIETEMRRRKGGVEAPPEGKGEGLFEFPSHLKVDAPAASESNISISTAMLTAIPEVDLGRETKNHNVVATEVARRRMMEREEMMRSGMAGMGIPRVGPGVPGSGMLFMGSGRATDDVVVERFKKRMRK